MAQIPGSVPLTGKVAPTDDTDTFATHVDIYGEGGYMTVANTAERDAITSERRKQGMAVFVNDTNEMYILQDGVTNADWVLFSGGGGSNPDMQDVFDNSTPNIIAVDASKTLSLSAGTTNILTDTGSGGSGEITIQSGDAGKIVELQLDSANAEVNLTSHGLINTKAIDSAVSTQRFGEISTELNNLGFPGAVVNVKSQGVTADNNILTRVSSSRINGGVVEDCVLELSPVGGTTLLNSWKNTTVNADDIMLVQGDRVEIRSHTALTEIRNENNAITGSATIVQQYDGGTNGYANKITASGSVGTNEIVVNEKDVLINIAGGAVTGDVLASKTTGALAQLEWQPGVQQLKVNLTEAEIQTLHTSGIDIILSGGIPSNKFLNVLNVLCYVDTQFTNSETLKFYIDSCSAGGGFSNPIYQADLITGQPVGTGTYAGRSNSAESFGSNCQALTVKLTGASGVPINSGGVGGIDVYVSYQFIDK